MSKANVRALRIAVLVTVLAVFSNAPVDAQAVNGAFEVGIEAGPFILVASGGREMLGVLGLFGEPHVDYFLTDGLAVGATGFFYHTTENDPSLPSISFRGAYSHVNFHFKAGSQIYSYIGARIGVFKPNSEMLFGGGIQIGLKFFATRQFSINGQLSVAVHPASEGVGILSCLGLGLSYHLE